MERLYESLIELLGKPRPASSEILMRLIEDLGEKSVVDCIDEKVWFYQGAEKLESDIQHGIWENFR